MRSKVSLGIPLTAFELKFDPLNLVIDANY